MLCCFSVASDTCITALGSAGGSFDAYPVDSSFGVGHAASFGVMGSANEIRPLTLICGDPRMGSLALDGVVFLLDFTCLGWLRTAISVQCKSWFQLKFTDSVLWKCVFCGFSSRWHLELEIFEVLRVLCLISLESMLLDVCGVAFCLSSGDVSRLLVGI
ncbi:hypothetical protein Nepgr_033982 [Nepenthes gracilis]|uniref:Uncharacterized protein n=1 Tax=Nepenthes gracilis TaxID=150966 RepID=A0AAD3TN74_NEPGR|nr:hypothetical protein Nepgr_033982 [Nepenthes gracilis]